jgi:hypothetical protein
MSVEDHMKIIRLCQTQVLPLLRRLYAINHHVKDHTLGFIVMITKNPINPTYAMIIDLQHKTASTFEFHYMVRTTNSSIEKIEHDSFIDYDITDPQWLNKIETDCKTIFPPERDSPGVAIDTVGQQFSNHQLWTALHKLATIAEALRNANCRI